MIVWLAFQSRHDIKIFNVFSTIIININTKCKYNILGATKINVTWKMIFTLKQVCFNVVIIQLNILSVLKKICQYMVILVILKIICSRNERTSAKKKFLKSDAIKNCGSFIIFDHWLYVKEFSLLDRIKSLVC